MDDRRLRLIVIDELDFEPSIDAGGIEVTVQHGVVTLSGQAGSYVEARAAAAAACRVKGVRAIANQIEVSSPRVAATSDAELARRALDILSWDAAVPRTVKVKVQAGRIWLSGTVERHCQRLAAEHAVSRLAGVVAVSNLIALKRLDHHYDIARAIEEALRRSAELDARKIRIMVTGDDTVTLDGEVHACHERAIVARAAWSAPGVQGVEDRLRVNQHSGLGDRLTEESQRPT